MRHYEKHGRKNGWIEIMEDTNTVIKKNKEKFYKKECDKLKTAGSHSIPYKALVHMNDPEKPPTWSVNQLQPQMTDTELAEDMADFFVQISNEFVPLIRSDIQRTYDAPFDVLQWGCGEDKVTQKAILLWCDPLLAPPTFLPRFPRQQPLQEILPRGAKIRRDLLPFQWTASGAKNSRWAACQFSAVHVTEYSVTRTYQAEYGMIEMTKCLLSHRKIGLRDCPGRTNTLMTRILDNTTTCVRDLLSYQIKKKTSFTCGRMPAPVWHNKRLREEDWYES